MTIRSKGRRIQWMRKLRQRWLPARADESGITTLEWLLIVAAVAGLAALAVVLVQNVVSETSEQIAGSSARRTAAEIAASTVQQEARNPDDLSNDRWDTWAKWDRYFTAKCDRLRITYGDAGVTSDPKFTKPSNEVLDDPLDQPKLSAAEDGQGANQSRARADCTIIDAP